MWYTETRISQINDTDTHSCVSVCGNVRGMNSNDNR